MTERKVLKQPRSRRPPAHFYRDRRSGKSTLRNWRGQILTMRRQGASLRQIQAWLYRQGCVVSHVAVLKYLRKHPDQRSYTNDSLPELPQQIAEQIINAQITTENAES